MSPCFVYECESIIFQSIFGNALGSPIKNPVNNPSKSPTSNPSRKSTAYGSFGSQVSSLPFGVVKSFDLYLLIDTTRTYEQINNYCKQYKLMSGTSPSSCFDLLMDYAIEVVKSISVASNGYYSNDLSKGLRVQASLIQCVGSTKTPSSTILFTLTGDSSIIMNGLNNARTNTQLTETASCPIQGLYDVIQKIENKSNMTQISTIITLTGSFKGVGTSGGGYGYASLILSWMIAIPLVFISNIVFFGHLRGAWEHDWRETLRISWGQGVPDWLQQASSSPPSPSNTQPELKLNPHQNKVPLDIKA